MTKHDNDGREWENIEIDKVTAGDITIKVMDSGTEDASTFYLQKDSLGSGFILRPDDNVAIVRIGGKTYRDPIPVSSAGFVISKIKDFASIVIRTLNDNTHIDLVVM